MEVYNILFNRLLSETAKQKASDLHLSVGSPPVIRKDGQLLPLKEEKIIEQETLSRIINSFLEEEEKKTLEEKREITVVKILGGHFRFKINIYYQKKMIAASFRLIPEVIRDFSSLNLPPAVSNFSRLTSGLLLVSGPYGSGKTTTIGAILEKINTEFKKRIITIEDPIEIFFSSKNSIVEQRQVGHDMPNIIDGLKYCLSQEIDVLAVSEIKNNFSQSIPLILELASSNCFVILETGGDSTIRVVEKILEGYPSSRQDSARMLLADVLEGILIQKLLPKIGGGLVTALEVVIGTSAVKSVIREGKVKQIQTIIQTSGNAGMINMDKSLSELAREGQISRETALAEAENKDDFKVINRQ